MTLHIAVLNLVKSVLLGLWLKVYRKLQNTSDLEAKTLTSSYMSFTYHPIPRRAIKSELIGWI
jgi:hypothetical protein